MELQRSAGNAAVCRMLGSRTPSVQRMPGPVAQDEQPQAGPSQQGRTVISGHGRFGDNQLLPKDPDKPRSRALTATFAVPEGIELVVYAPPGAWLENEAAKQVESGDLPTADDLEMVGPNNKRKPLPSDYPKTFTAGQQVINYKVMPLASQHLGEGATTVDEGITLQQKVRELAAARENQDEDAPPLTVHYACCGVGASKNPVIDKLFVHRNYTVILKTTPKEPTPEPEAKTPSPEPAPKPKRRRKSKAGG
ncbi:putative adhesin [Streptomyces jumonjinensis]|uniref:Putative adhesin Stv domain-containing protein n=1 Tax=Streptomyces jumonjinensis TaxID=1945 RepID=A0A646KQR0_STRJU|nr:hypothetical protein [Streptomyces jumonjinensis]MQT04669.1 hypothetical protein [Streptomyces jumonjinensis]